MGGCDPLKVHKSAPQACVVMLSLVVAMATTSGELVVNE